MNLMKKIKTERSQVNWPAKGIDDLLQGEEIPTTSKVEAHIVSQIY